jgi:ABC-type transport system substrate-binding protein
MFRYGIAPATQKLMLERGEADMVEYYSFGPDVHPDTFGRNPNITVIRSPAFRTFVYALNVQKPNSPLRDKRVRKAFALAFDYEAMKEVFFGNAQVPNGFLPPGFAAHDPSRPAFRRDVAAARRLMAEAGQAQGFEITCRFSGVEEQGRKLGLILQASLRDIGVRVTLEPNPPFAIFTAQMANLETAPICGGHRLMSPLTADAGAYMRQVFGANNTGKPFNDSWYANPEVERLLDEAERTSDLRRQVELWRQAESLIIEDQPVIFTAFATPIFEPVQRRVANYLAHPLDYSGVFTYYPVHIRR